MKFADIKKSICVFLKVFVLCERNRFSSFVFPIRRRCAAARFLEDKWSWNYKGFWVDIGAYHPSNLSNTKVFSLNGWRGINVDLFLRQRLIEIKAGSSFSEVDFKHSKWFTSLDD